MNIALIILTHILTPHLSINFYKANAKCDPTTTRAHNYPTVLVSYNHRNPSHLLADTNPPTLYQLTPTKAHLHLPTLSHSNTSKTMHTIPTTIEKAIG